MSSLDLCLGIDFGTTNSCLSVWHNNNAIIIIMDIENILEKSMLVPFFIFMHIQVKYF